MSGDKLVKHVPHPCGNVKVGKDDGDLSWESNETWQTGINKEQVEHPSSWITVYTTYLQWFDSSCGTPVARYAPTSTSLPPVCFLSISYALQAKIPKYN